MTMKTVYQELLETREAELNAARDHIAELYELLSLIEEFLEQNADYDMTETGNYVPCNAEARLLNEINMVAP